MKSKIFITLFAIISSVSTIFAWDYERVPIGDLYYNLDTINKTAEVTWKNYDPYYNFYNRDWEITTISIPSSINYLDINYSVTSIGAYAFCNCWRVTSATIPNSVISIGDKAFAFSGITSLSLPNSITTIGSSVFQRCFGLTSPVYNARIFVSLPMSFSGEYTVPDSIETIADDAFYWCNNLNSVNLPNSIKNIGSLAFDSCTNLTSINIPNSVKTIGERVFYCCNRLSSIHIDNLTAWCNILFSRDPWAFSNGYHLYLNDIEVTDLVIPNNVTNIGNYAFNNCIGLTSVSFPNSITSIGNYAFAGCTSLTSISMSNCITNIGRNAFYNCVSLTDIIIPNSVQSIGQSAFYNCTGLTSVTIGNNVTSIEYETFRGCANLSNIIIGNGVIDIGNSAFSGCIALSTMNIPHGVQNIGQGAFSGCTSLTNISLPNTITSIGGVAFYSSNLMNITIPNRVTSIGNRAFLNCSNLMSCVCMAEIPPTLGEDVFANCIALSSIDVPCNTLPSYVEAWNAYASLIDTFNPYTIDLHVNDNKAGTVRRNSEDITCENPIEIEAIPNKGYQFNQWSDGNTDNPRQVIVTQDSTFTAVFGINMCSWLVESNDLEMGAVITNFNDAYYQYGTQITVEASPNSGYKFVKWNDGKKFNPYKFSILDDKYLLAIFMEETEEQDTTTVTLTSTTATFTWPFIIGGFSYSLTIYLDAACTIPFCTITFNQYGQFIGISFGNRAPRRYAEQEEGFTYTVSGLDANTEYYFKMETMNEDNKLINTDEGSFMTQNEATGVEYQQSDMISPYKVMINGQIFILRGDRTYTLTGAEVK